MVRRDVSCPHCGDDLKQWPSDNPMAPEDYFECDCGFSVAATFDPDTGQPLPDLSTTNVNAEHFPEGRSRPSGNMLRRFVGQFFPQCVNGPTLQSMKRLHDMNPKKPSATTSRKIVMTRCPVGSPGRRQNTIGISVASMKRGQTKPIAKAPETERNTPKAIMRASKNGDVFTKNTPQSNRRSDFVSFIISQWPTPRITRGYKPSRASGLLCDPTFFSLLGSSTLPRNRMLPVTLSLMRKRKG
jgi:hypothetical protein